MTEHQSGESWEKEFPEMAGMFKDGIINSDSENRISAKEVLEKLFALENEKDEEVNDDLSPELLIVFLKADVQGLRREAATLRGFLAHYHALVSALERQLEEMETIKKQNSKFSNQLRKAEELRDEYYQTVQIKSAILEKKDGENRQLKEVLGRIYFVLNRVAKMRRPRKTDLEESVSEALMEISRAGFSKSNESCK